MVVQIFAPAFPSSSFLARFFAIFFHKRKNPLNLPLSALKCRSAFDGSS
jgi:hypothetical protein